LRHLDETEDAYDGLDEDLEGLQPMSVSEALQSVLDFVIDIIKSLLRMSMTIRNPAPQDKYLATRHFDANVFEAYAQYDINHIRESYSGRPVPEYLINRLARANTNRRQI
jgi:hypothetical protein